MSEQWYYGQNGTQKGPVSVEVMHQLIASGQLKPDDLVWREGMANWAPVSTIPELMRPAEPISAPSPSNPPPNPMSSAPIPASGPMPVGYSTLPQNSGAATTSMVLGICSIPLCMCPLIGIGLGVAALIVAGQVRNAPNQGHAKAGMICGIVGIVLSGLNSIAGIAMRLG